MKFSYRWLRDLVPGLQIEPTELERVITMKTAECEGTEVYGAHLAQVRAVRVESVEPLPKGKNKVVSIETGNGHVHVVCGAPNVRPGMLAAWVPPGTALAGKLIGRAVIEGVESEGMLASGAELALNRDAAGLLELENVQPGDSLLSLSPDVIIEIDNKSLTHRPDLWGHIGMAREVAAITHQTLQDPVNLAVLPTGDPAVRVHIEDLSLCPRYSALRIENVQVDASPLWLQARLESIGLNPINNLVDVTNYILAELPQPMHAFDADKIKGAIRVRRAQAGEKIAALNGQTYDLSPTDLVIADDSGPVAIAGVIGGAATAISSSTTRVILESANFQAASVRLTSSRLKLRTDASVRFEKSLDPENTLRGIARAVELISRLCPAMQVVGGATDVCAEIAPLAPVELPVTFVQRKLGKDVPEQQIIAILRALGFGVANAAPGLLAVTIPTWRATKDISTKQDLVEEIGRIVGYGEITPTAPLAACVPPPSNPFRLYLRQIRSGLSAQGFTEVSNYSFLNEADLERFSMDPAAHIAVRNPIASELTHLRRSLLPGLFKNVVANVRHLQEFRLFEIGREIHPSEGGSLPHEINHCGGVLHSAHADEQDFFEGKRVVEALFPRVKLAASEAKPYEHPARAATIDWAGVEIGRLFEIHPSLMQAEGIEGRSIFFDIDLDAAYRIASSRTIRYSPLRKYPSSGFDLSVIAELREPVANIETSLTEFAGDQLVLLDFVRQYAGPPLPEGSKSVSYHLEIGALDRTLTADEVTFVRNRIIDGMRARGYDLRV